MQTRFILIASVSVVVLAALLAGWYYRAGRQRPLPAPPPSSAPVTEPQAVPPATEPENPKLTVAVVFSGSEVDPWTREVANTLGNTLGIEPWSKPSTDGHLDIFGPFASRKTKPAFNCWIVMTGLTGVVGYAGQSAIGAEARQWLKRTKPDVVWLDGDQTQMQIGAQLDPTLPIVFSGVVLDFDIFYGPERAVTGVYRRHSLSRAIGAIWREAPKATRFALICDDSPQGLTRIADLKLYEAGLPEGHQLLVQPPVTSWDGLRATLRALEGKADGVVIATMGEEQAALELRRDPCPADLLSATDLPVVVLGPTKLDNRGALVLSIKPSAQVAPALERVCRILAGEPARSMLMTVPDEMQAYRSAPNG